MSNHPRPRKKTAPIHCQIRVTPELRERLDRFLLERGWSITQIVNEGIRRVVDESDVGARLVEVRGELEEMRKALVSAMGRR